MIHGTDDDPDVLRDSIRNDDMPPRLWSHGLVPALPLRPMRSAEDIDRDVLALRRRAERLAHVLQVMTMADPPTIPEGEEGLLMVFVVSLEDRIAAAANDLGHHMYARRAPGRPISCPRCSRPIDRAAEACFA